MTSQEIVQRTPQQELVAQIRGDDFQTQVGAALEGSGISPAKFVRVAITAINENADLVKAERASLFGSLMRCAQFELLPDSREAAIVMFGQRAVLMVMVAGLRKIAAEHGWSLIATVVHENDSFDPDLENARANHKPARLGTDPGEPLGAYAIAEHKDGRRLLEVMNLQEIEAVRATSRAKNSGPWVDFWGEMARKTVVRRLFKSLPLDPKDRERIDRVLAATAEDGVVELYGAENSPSEPHPEANRAPVPAAADGPLAPQPEADQEGSAGSGTGPAAPGPDEVPFEGEEPTFEPEPGPTADAASVTFTHGKHAGKTLQQVYDLGKEGIGYIAWAHKNWKPDQQPMRGALDEFGMKHPEVTV